MKHIKIFEEFKEGELTKEQRKWLDEVVQGAWKMNSEGKIDVEGWVDCSHQRDLKRFPVEFGRVSGSFSCGYCSSLGTLEGCPREIGTYFNCYDCTSLRTLEGCPRIVGSWFTCTHCNSLTTLAGAPEEVQGNINVKECNRIPQAERDLLKHDKDLFLQWANSGMKVEEFLHQKRGSLKGREFGF